MCYPVPMSTGVGLRERKKRAARDAMSLAATLLFIERGFDNVTVDDVAKAAGVARMTVFNYFPRKEDLFFDREDEGRTLAEEALVNRAAGVAPVEALRALILRLADEGHPFASFDAKTARFRRTMNASPALRARAREIRDGLARDLGRMLARAAGARTATPEMRLAAAMLVTAWSVAQEEGHRAFARTGRSEPAKAAFLAVMERAFDGVRDMVAEAGL